MKAILAFYKGNGSILDKFVKYMTDGEYSRVAIIDSKGQWYTSSPVEGVIKKNITPEKGKYDFMEVECEEEDYEKAIKFLEAQIGKENNFFGLLLSRSFHFLNYEEKWFSSELAANFLNLINRGDINSAYFKFSPSSLLERLKMCQIKYETSTYKFIEG